MICFNMGKLEVLLIYRNDMIDVLLEEEEQNVIEVYWVGLEFGLIILFNDVMKMNFLNDL